MYKYHTRGYQFFKGLVPRLTRGSHSYATCWSVSDQDQDFWWAKKCAWSL